MLSPTWKHEEFMLPTQTVTSASFNKFLTCIQRYIFQGILPTRGLHVRSKYGLRPVLQQEPPPHLIHFHPRTTFQARQEIDRLCFPTIPWHLLWLVGQPTTRPALVPWLEIYSGKKNTYWPSQFRRSILSELQIILQAPIHCKRLGIAQGYMTKCLWFLDIMALMRLWDRWQILKGWILEGLSVQAWAAGWAWSLIVVMKLMFQGWSSSCQSTVDRNTDPRTLPYYVTLVRS